MVRIVHFSDLHLDFSSLEDTQNFIVKPFINDLIKNNEETKIDIIAFSGDLIDKGGKSFNNDISYAFLTFEETVIKPIITALGLSNENFLLVPGNHDINRSLDNYNLEVGLRHTLTNIPLINNFIDSNDVEGIKRIIPYKEFESYFYENIQSAKSISNFQSNICIDINDRKVGVTLFNSSWRCYDDNDKENLLLGERQITRARDFIKDCDLKLGLIHHPLDFFSPIESKVIENMILKDYDILLCGHVHSGSSWTKSTLLGTTFISISPSNWSKNIRKTDIDYSNGYALIDYCFETRKVETSYRRYSHAKESYVPNTDLGDDLGKSIFQLPCSFEVEKLNRQIDLIDTIRNVYLETINEHLITYNTETTAPKSIQDMFVLPKIVVDEDYEIEGEKIQKNEITYDLEKICTTYNNILLVGGKESGKTVLLDRILIELTENHKVYKKVPVHVNFDELRPNTRIETIISRYLHIGINEVNDFINNNYITLLLDNLVLDETSLQFQHKLRSFLEDHKNAQLIATCYTSIEGELPIETLSNSSNFLSMFKIAYIKSFRSKEIRELTSKWFSSTGRFNQPEKLENLYKIFSALNLPKTPMAVSMFLWIIEQQENYQPINNATMLENFIERIFTKTSDIEILSSVFNYKNKERLLTEIALYMYNTNNHSYRLSYKEIRDFIYNNLKIKKFDYDEELLLRHFIERGILTVDKEGSDRFVRFKFNCFFEFFLMKNIDINPEFKKFIFSEENYLKFVDEIDYYTGLKRDEAELLEEFQRRMNNAFRELINNIEKVQYKYDNIFETLDTITSRLDENKIKKITQNKPSEEQIDEMNDDALEALTQENGIIKKEEELSPLKRLERMWIITAKVLKNTEETSKENLKTSVYKDIVKSSMAFAALYKFLLKDYFSKSDVLNTIEDEERKQGIEIIDRFLPFIHQTLIYQTLGTAKLNIVIKEVIDEIIKSDDVSDFEKFISVFTYADLKGNDYMNYIKLLIKNRNRHFIKDMIFLKLINYYFYKTNSKELEGDYKNLLGDLISKNEPIKHKVDYHRKGKLISTINHKKLIMKIKENNN